MAWTQSRSKTSDAQGTDKMLFLVWLSGKADPEQAAFNKP
jgi:hypothetical protein